MPGKTREDDFLEKLADLLRANRNGEQPIQPAAGGEGAGGPLDVDPARPNEPLLSESEPLLSEVAAPLPRPAS